MLTLCVAAFVGDGAPVDGDLVLGGHVCVVSSQTRRARVYDE